MSDLRSPVEYRRALEDFKSARAKARMQHLWAAVTGRKTDLLPYDDISRKLRTGGLSSKGVQEIPVSAIVGSVNRYQDFDRNFLPLHDDDMERWARVKSAMTSPGSPGLPPITVYKISDAYFVMDGNHRVSIAREMGFETIEAYVTEIQSRVPLSPEDSPEDIILKAEYAQFLDETKFDKVVPGEDLTLTFPGQYETLREHIRVHRHYMGIEQLREIPPEEALKHWYEHVYKPIVNMIREQDILKEFPNRTETDLYIWVLDHQTYLEEHLGWAIGFERAASDLVDRKATRLGRVIRRWGRKFVRMILPNQLEDFSSPGEWHRKKQAEGENLFSEILVAMSGREDSWIALEQAIIVAHLEKAKVRGLIVKTQPDETYIREVDVEQAFNERLQHSGLPGNLVFDRGNIAERIIDRAEYNDLVILKLSHPPSPKIFSRFSSGMRMILRRSSRPVLVVKDQVSTMNHMIVPYDGSAKSQEALFISHYLAERFSKRVTLLVVDEDEVHGKSLLAEASEILGDLCTKKIYQKPFDQVSKTILLVAREESADAIIMGGYGLPPVLEVVFGSTVDGVLRGTHLPVIVCQ